MLSGRAGVGTMHLVSEKTTQADSGFRRQPERERWPPGPRSPKTLIRAKTTPLSSSADF